MVDLKWGDRSAPKLSVALAGLWNGRDSPGRFSHESLYHQRIVLRPNTPWSVPCNNVFSRRERASRIRSLPGQNRSWKWIWRVISLNRVDYGLLDHSRSVCCGRRPQADYQSDRAFCCFCSEMSRLILWASKRFRFWGTYPSLQIYF